MGAIKKLPLAVQIFYGIGVSYAIVDQIFVQWVLYYYLPPADADGLFAILPAAYIALALVIARLVDMIADPLVGYWSDKVNSPWGRRIPFIGLGAIPLAVTTVALFYPPSPGETLTPFLYLAGMGSLFFVFYTVVGAPYNALIPELAQNRADRLDLATWQSVFRLLYTAIAMIAPGALIEAFGGGDQGIRYMAVLMSGIVVIGLLFTTFTVKERRYSGGKQSDTPLLESIKSLRGNTNLWMYFIGFLFFFLGFNILRSSVNYYVVEIMGYGEFYITVTSALLFGGAAIFFLPVNRLCKRIGYRKPMLWSLLLLILFCVILFNVGKVLPHDAGFVAFLLTGIPISGAAFIFPPAMLSEISAVNTIKRGENIEGMMFGIQGFFLKLAFMLAIAILPIVLVMGGEVPLAESIVADPEGVEQTGVYATTIVAMISFAISFVFYYFYREERAEDFE